MDSICSHARDPYTLVPQTKLGRQVKQSGLFYQAKIMKMDSFLIPANGNFRVNYNLVVNQADFFALP